MEKEIQDLVQSGLDKMQKIEEEKEHQKFLIKGREREMESTVFSSWILMLPEVLRKYVSFKHYETYGEHGRHYYYTLAIPGIYPLTIEVPVQHITDVPYVKVIDSIIVKLFQQSIPLRDIDILIAKAEEYQRFKDYREQGIVEPEDK